MTWGNARKKSATGSKAVTSRIKDGLSPRILGFKLPWYWTLIALVTLVVLTHLQIRLKIKDTAFSMLQPFQHLGQGSFRNVDYDFDGTLRVRDIAIQPEDDIIGIGIGELTIESPGIWWVIRQTLPGGRRSRGGGSGIYPPTKTLAFRLSNIEWGDYYLGYAVPGLDWTGGYNGALFEAEGCPNDGFWSRSDLSDRLKLDPGSGDIEVKFVVTGERGLVRTVHFGHAGLSELTMVSTYELPESAVNFLNVSSRTWRTTSTRWDIADHGFVRRRNEFCAEEAGVDLATMQERHLQSVERILAVRGTRASAELLDAYAIYARDGGTLQYQTNLPPGRAWEDYSKSGFAGLLAGIAATVTVGDQSVAYQLTEIPKQALPDSDFGSTWGLLELESGKPGVSVAPTLSTAEVRLAAPPAETTPAGITTIAPKSAPPTPPTVKKESIEQLVGRRVELVLDGNRRLRGTLETLDKRQLEMRIGGGSSYARLTIQRDRVVSVRRI